MAKGQQHSNKEQRKQKSADKKQSGPKYLRPAELVQAAKPAPARGGPKK